MERAILGSLSAPNRMKKKTSMMMSSVEPKEPTMTLPRVVARSPAFKRCYSHPPDTGGNIASSTPSDNMLSGAHICPSIANVSPAFNQSETPSNSAIFLGVVPRQHPSLGISNQGARLMVRSR